jgi:hypothetical protein
MAMIDYEQRLNSDTALAFREGGMHFEKGSAVHKALRRITQRLGELAIPYAVVGGMAMFYHGYRRFTEDVDILVTAEGLVQIHEELSGRGWIEPFEGSKQLRDAENGVRVEFLVAGEYPGDGKPKPVAFPDPSKVCVDAEGMHFLQLSTLLELKLASGMSNPRRATDLADVQKMIETLGLPLEFGDRLHSFVQDKYKNLWDIVHTNPP